jgi:Fic family protein
LNPFVPKGLLYKDNEDKLRLESRNGVIQAQFVIYTAGNWLQEDRLTPALLRELQRLAVNQIYRCAGHFRDGPVVLDGALHEPPAFEQVPGMIDELCQYVSDHWTETPVHLSSYIMWRMNWVHPFYGGNGRTSRAASYLILCAKLGFVLPGTKTIPELIQNNPGPYYAALRAADAAWNRGVMDLSEMERLLSSLLAQQLVQIHEQATGSKAPPQR